MNFLKPSIALAALLLACHSAVACPDCALKSSGGLIEPQTMTAKMAFSSSTLLLLGVFFSVVGFMVWIMVKTCRELQQERPLSSSLNH
ncbi:MAG: hypothetical protein WCI42_06370 [Verrucomicrobiota bacterium]|jgi:H+/Cl- antiporter ClcA